MTQTTFTTPRRRSHLEALFAHQVALAALPAPEREHRFAHGRRWRFDFAWPAQRVALEVEGNMFLGGRGADRGMGGGRHQRAFGFQDDCVKYAAAVMLGWVVLRATGPLVTRGYAVRWLALVLGSRPHGAGTLGWLTVPPLALPDSILPEPHRQGAPRVHAARSAR